MSDTLRIISSRFWHWWDSSTTLFGGQAFDVWGRWNCFGTCANLNSLLFCTPILFYTNIFAFFTATFFWCKKTKYWCKKGRPKHTVCEWRTYYILIANIIVCWLKWFQHVFRLIIDSPISSLSSFGIWYPLKLFMKT